MGKEQVSCNATAAAELGARHVPACVTQVHRWHPSEPAESAVICCLLRRVLLTQGVNAMTPLAHAAFQPCCVLAEALITSNCTDGVLS